MTRSWLGTVALGTWRRGFSRAQLHEDHPVIVSRSPRVTYLQEIAEHLAAEGREYAEAVKMLALAAGSHKADLIHAAAAVRSIGWVHEEILIYRANQLLLAAATGEPLEPLTHDQAAWFRELDTVLEGDLPAAFRRSNRAYFATSISDRGDDFLDQFTERYSALLAEQEAGSGAFYVLVDEDGAVLGRFNLYNVNGGVADVGYRVAQHVAGHGVATATVRELCVLARGLGLPL